MCVALGAQRIVVVGYAGALQPGLDPGDVVLCERAIRDEGTSYHYLPAAAEARADPELLDVCRRGLTAAEIDAVRGRSWTTDAPFRETETEVREMQADGVLAVEMELAAVYAAAQVRGVAAAGLCVVSDSLSDLTWRPHFRDPHVRERLRAVFDVTVATLARSTADALPVTRSTSVRLPRAAAMALSTRSDRRPSVLLAPDLRFGPGPLHSRPPP